MTYRIYVIYHIYIFYIYIYVHLFFLYLGQSTSSLQENRLAQIKQARKWGLAVLSTTGSGSWKPGGSPNEWLPPTVMWPVGRLNLNLLKKMSFLYLFCWNMKWDDFVHIFSEVQLPPGDVAWLPSFWACRIFPWNLLGSRMENFRQIGATQFC